MWENVRDRDHLECLDIDGSAISKWIFEKWYVVMDWTDLSHDKDRLHAVVSEVMNLLVP